jgi:hypothetical protein
MFDCPLIRLQDGKIPLFAPAVVDANIAMTVLSNLSNRRATQPQEKSL